MACTSCFTNLLDLALPGLRTGLFETLNNMLALPLAGFQAALNFGLGKLSELGAQLGSWASQFNFSLNLGLDFGDLMGDLGILPGDCIQLDSVLGLLSSFQGLLNFDFSNPFDKAFDTLGNVLGGISASIGAMNGLIAGAFGNFC